MSSAVSACSNERQEFIGHWASVQASNAVDYDNELLQYSEWDITEETIRMSQAQSAGPNTGRQTGVFITVPYDRKSKHGIDIDGQSYSIEVSADQFTLKNDRMEIQFKRAD